jgi:hypothetical protein
MKRLLFALVLGCSVAGLQAEPDPLQACLAKQAAQNQVDFAARSQARDQYFTSQVERIQAMKAEQMAAAQKPVVYTPEQIQREQLYQLRLIRDELQARPK